jgi:rubrerythrin
MENSNGKINDLLVEAMNSEKKAREFYLNASEKAKSNAGKKLFKELAGFEQNHYMRVKRIIESRNIGQEITETGLDQETPTVRSEIEGEFEPNKDEIVMILNLAIESEKNAQVRYENIANMLEDSKEKEIFNSLAQDERNHQKILEDEFYHISNKGTIVWE